jgi:hypothetical protein
MQNILKKEASHFLSLYLIAYLVALREYASLTLSNKRRAYIFLFPRYTVNCKINQKPASGCAAGLLGC